ncbi:MAG: hypothetical protein ABIQ10_11105 [Gemmatimonadaceae bacterium]
MPYLDKSTGTWRIKRSYGVLCGLNIPAFNISTKTKKEELAKKIELKLDELSEEWGMPGAALLARVANKELTLIDAYQLVKTKKVNEASTIVGSELLADKWNRLLPVWNRKNGTLISVRTRHDYEQYLKLLIDFDIFPGAKHRELPEALGEYRVYAEKKGYAATFRKLRAACLSYARNTDGSHSELWNAVKNIHGMSDRIVGGKKKKNKALRYFDALALIEKLPEERMQKVARTMLHSGMSAGEYVAGYEIFESHLRINGTKNELRVRDIPKLSNSMEPVSFTYWKPGTGTVRNNASGEPLSYQTFNAAVVKASNGEHSSNTFRHSYQLYLRQAGLDSWSQFRYSGHRPPASEQVQEKYTQSEDISFILADAERLIAYLNGERVKPKETRKTLTLLD